LFGYPKTIKFKDLLGSLTWKKFFMTVFEFIGQFFVQNDVFKLQEVFSDHGIRIEKGLEASRHFLFYRFYRSDKNIPKTFLKTRHKIFLKLPCCLFSKPLEEGIFSVSGIFIEDYLRSLTCREKFKNRYRSKYRCFFHHTNNFFFF
jgi:hypothetical protein